jgi:hypothetical protein
MLDEQAAVGNEDVLGEGSTALAACQPGAVSAVEVDHLRLRMPPLHYQVSSVLANREPPNSVTLLVEPADTFGILTVEGPHGDLVNGFALTRVALWCRNRNDVTRPGAFEATFRTSHDDVGLFLTHCKDRIKVSASMAYQMDATAQHSGERSCNLHRILVGHRRTNLAQ